MPRQSFDIKQAVAHLREGQPLIFDTDTVAGIGVAVDFAPDCASLHAAKGRDEGKPIAWLVSSAKALDEYGKNVPDYARKLAEMHWPGALTLVVEAASTVPAAYRSQTGTIGLRMPADAELLTLIVKTGCPLATTSANFSGCEPFASVAQIPADFAPDVPVFAERDQVDDMHPAHSVASTVIDCTASAPQVLRAGTIPISET